MMSRESAFDFIYRAVPLAAAAVSVGFGAYILRQGRTPDDLTAGLTMFQFALICLALYANAATVLWQHAHPFGGVGRYGYPIFAWLVAIVATGFSIWMMRLDIAEPVYFVVGHVTFAMAMVCVCIASVVSASAHFPQLVENASLPEGATPASRAPFRGDTVASLSVIPVIATLIVWGWSFFLLRGIGSGTPEAQSNGGHLMMGLAMVCTSLVALVFTVLRQTQNTYTARERVLWPGLAFLMGLITVLWGVYFASSPIEPFRHSAGFLMIGLGMNSWAILAKVLVLAVVWKSVAPMAGRIEIIPVLTTLVCLVLSIFLFESANPNLLTGARLLLGLGLAAYPVWAIVSVMQAHGQGTPIVRGTVPVSVRSE